MGNLSGPGTGMTRKLKIVKFITFFVKDIVNYLPLWAL